LQIFNEWIEEIGNPTERIKHVVDTIHPSLLVLGSNNKNILERYYESKGKKQRTGARKE
jgi:hypothetical protein